MASDTEEAIGELVPLMGEIDGLMVGTPYDAAHTKWVFSVRFALNRWFGAQNTLTQTFSSLTFRIPGGTLISGFDPVQAAEDKRVESYRAQLQSARGILQAAVDQLTRFGLEEMRAAPGPSAASPNKNVFITHGGKPPMLAKVEQILRTLGFSPIVVEQEASLGKAVDDLVPEQMRKCVCSIVLATKDPENPDSKNARPNVLHEIGLAQEILGDRIIYLKEKSLDYPSNLAPKVWQSFSNDNAEPVWDKIVKELRGFGFMQ